MATEQIANNPHDVRSLTARIVNFYRFFNKQDWSRCYEYIDPVLRAKGSVGPGGYSETMRAFFRAYSPIRDLRIVSLHTHIGAQARSDSRDFAYVVISCFQVPTILRLSSKPRWMSMSRVSPRQTTMFPGGGSFDRAR